MYHRLLKAPVCCQEMERGPGILLLVRLLWKTLADSAELGCKKQNETKQICYLTYIKRLCNDLNFILMLIWSGKFKKKKDKNKKDFRATITKLKWNDLLSIYFRIRCRRQTWSLAHQRCGSVPEFKEGKKCVQRASQNILNDLTKWHKVGQGRWGAAVVRTCV